ncbi:MAG: DEAD/DEAH box helicase, partial [Candidatus Thiodiazotropha sp.]
MIWRNGILPDGAPEFASTLSHDLVSYGDTLMSLAMRILEQQGNESLARSAFAHAGEAIEAVVSKGDPDNPQRGFLRLLAASAFHLAHFSARAFSMLVSAINNGNLSMTERALALLILRSLNELESEITGWRLGGAASDGLLIAEINAAVDGTDELEDAEPVLDALDKALTDTLFSGLGNFLVALQRGEQTLVDAARAELRKGLDVAGALNMVPQWWFFRLAIHLIEDLWKSSFHTVLPQYPPQGANANWQSMRSLFTTSLYRRGRAEIELWPSQIDAARRSVDTSDDLVVSLPTSAGKTRVAELCILRCLSEGRRVVFVTPLRALSAQTEVSLQRTFGPLGKRISALYGSIGTSDFEEDALKARDIVVATPEKLDFALRNDPSIIDDVGLIVLDEGHMIGLGEREVRYEVQIQRLLRRQDADHRRIVCLSAILPDGEQFDDFVNWIRRDKDGGPVTADWRPTRIRFGEVMWRGDRAQLDLRVGEESPFVRSFFGQKAPLHGQRTALFPRDQRELVLATAWRLVDEGQSVLIYCPIRASVEPFAKAIVDLSSRGFLDPVLDAEEARLSTALAIGCEWLGADHPILACLKLGVAIHHGALPTPFRKEMERLLRDGVLKITVSSPPLAQGLNLTATAVVMHSLHRNRKIIPASEFKNVIGRAGRAFIDLEGLVLFPIFEGHAYRRNQWRSLISAASGQEMESGLVRLVLTFLLRLKQALGNPDLAHLQEYIVNNAATWQFPEIAGENDDERQ